MRKWQELTFPELVGALVKVPFQGKLLALDPGETTGYAVFENQTLLEADQAKTKPIEDGYAWLNGIFLKHKPTQVVYETYRVYAWKAEDHANSEIFTAQFIGTVKTVCAIHKVPHHTQSASIAKGFCTDEKLELWGFYRKGLKHARDALRHATYYQLHPVLDKKGPKKSS